MFVSMEKTLRVSSLLACLMVLGMITIFIITGVGQDPLQFIHPAKEYGQILLKNPAALRATIGLDNFFIVFYSTSFISLMALLLRRGAPRSLTLISFGLLFSLALFDMIENFHFMVMLSNAEQGILPSSTEISAQVWESLLKFHISYLGLFLLGFAIPRETRGERFLAGLSWFLQLPVGVLIYVTPSNISFLLVLVRFTYFVTALLLLAWLFGREEHDAGDSGARALSRGMRPGVGG